MESTYNYIVVAQAVTDLLQNIGKHQGLIGGIQTDVTFLTSTQCEHLYKFLVPYAESLKVYKPLLEELRNAASLE